MLQYYDKPISVHLDLSGGKTNTMNTPGDDTIPIPNKSNTPTTPNKQWKRRDKRNLAAVGILIAILLPLTVYATHSTQSSNTEQQQRHDSLVESIRERVESIGESQTQEKSLEHNGRVLNRSEAVELIRTHFPSSQWDNAYNIMLCESERDTVAHGDKGLMLYDEKNQEWIGDSLGLFQIRTGGENKDGTVWNRATLLGISADEFRTLLKNPEYNAQYARNLYDKYGWQPWSCSGS